MTEHMTNNQDGWMSTAFKHEATIKKLRAALEFYADPAAWKREHDPDDSVQIPDFYSETDFATMAIEALK